jgi:hypothetical protein
MIYQVGIGTGLVNRKLEFLGLQSLILRGLIWASEICAFDLSQQKYRGVDCILFFTMQQYFTKVAVRY